MKKASIIIHQNYVEVVVKNLHETGLMEIIDISKEDLNLESKNELINFKFDTCTSYKDRFSKLINILTKVTPKKKGIKAILHPDLPKIKIVEDKILDEMYSYAAGFINKIEKDILEDEQKLHKLDEEIKKINLNIQQLNYIKDFNVDVLDIRESKYLVIKAGKTTDIKSIRTQIDGLEKSLIYSKQFGTGKKAEWAVIVVTYISEKEIIEKIFRENVSEFNFQGLSGLPKDILNSLEKEKEEINKETKKIVKLLRDLADRYLNDLLALREELQIEIVKIEASNNFVKTNYTYIINGWILEKNQVALKESLTFISDDHVICNFESPSINPDNPPTYYYTPSWAGSFKTILEMFATPKYNDINPMFFVGIFFILFFSFMLGDAGYGLVILFCSLYGYIKLGKHSPFFKDWSFMGIWLGVTTTVVGFLTNGFFGDLIPRFIYGDPTKSLYSLDVMGVHLPIDGLRNPIIMLSIALILALVQLNLGITLGMYQSYRNKEYRALLLQYGSWIPLQLGGGLLIGYMILDWYLDTIFVYIAIIFTLIGIILLFIHTRGPVGFFSITGYVGDWLSYARLIALGLSTAGMALAINVVGELVIQMIPIIGFVIFIIVMILAHFANLIIQGLGAGVHSLRLQYIEFFNRFYEGGGREFTPFKIKRVYTKTKEKM
ncbi:MAG: V-type ATP synthase subunit I [Candidatus Thermoplasmatota archaeon]|nr:V-type ATP synthase subunit I [Candidatus Thermoplasmatota archaeon]